MTKDKDQLHLNVCSSRAKDRATRSLTRVTTSRERLHHSVRRTLPKCHRQKRKMRRRGGAICTHCATDRVQSECSSIPALVNPCLCLGIESRHLRPRPRPEMFGLRPCSPGEPPPLRTDNCSSFCSFRVMNELG